MNIVAIKECNSAQIPEIAYLCKDEITLYTGEDSNILPILSLGGKGVISVMANIIPNEVHDMVIYYLNGNYEAALSLQLKYVPLIKALFSDVNPIPVKAAMNALGYNVGNCRMPLCEMTDAKKVELINTLKMYDLKRGD